MHCHAFPIELRRFWETVSGFAATLSTDSEARREPMPWFRYAKPSCRSPPAVVVCPGEGALLYGPVAYRLDGAWMSWRGVTHVLNCVGQYTGSSDARSTNPDWAVTHHPDNIFQGVVFLDWCFTNVPSRRAFAKTFECVGHELQRSSTVVYVHCRNGQDRSGVTVYALLRVLFHLGHDDALLAMQRRRSLAGEPLLPRAELLTECQMWIETLCLG